MRNDSSGGYTYTITSSARKRTREFCKVCEVSARVSAALDAVSNISTYRVTSTVRYIHEPRAVATGGGGISVYIPPKISLP